MLNNRLDGVATKLWALDGANFTLDRGLVMIGASGIITIPAPTYLIQHERGLVLWDTGVSPLAADNVEEFYGPLAEHLGLVYPEDRRVDRQIEALGFSIEDVTHVVLSHTHLDHAGGMYLFPHAKHYVGAGDLRYGMWPDTLGGAFFRQSDIEPTRDWNWNDIHADFDLFGDGSIIILHCPGHTPGNLALLVRLSEQSFILTGDTVHLQEAADTGTPMPTDFDSQLAKRSARRMGQLRDSLGAELWVCHDPDDWTKFKHAPESYQ